MRRWLDLADGFKERIGARRSDAPYPKGECPQAGKRPCQPAAPGVNQDAGQSTNLTVDASHPDSERGLDMNISPSVSQLIHRPRRSGFTLIELLVVIAIIAILRPTCGGLQVRQPIGQERRRLG